MEFNEFRNKVKEALPDFLTDDLRNAEIKDTAVNKLQGESYSGISVTPEGSHVGVSINLEDAFQDYQTPTAIPCFFSAADAVTGSKRFILKKMDSAFCINGKMDSAFCING